MVFWFLELLVEEVNDDGSSSCVDTFLRSEPTPGPRPFLTIPCDIGVSRWYSCIIDGFSISENTWHSDHPEEMEIRIGKFGNLKNIANCKYSLKRGIVFLEEFQPEIISAHSTLIGCSIAPNIKGNAMKPLQVLFCFLKLSYLFE